MNALDRMQPCRALVDFYSPVRPPGTPCAPSWQGHRGAAATKRHVHSLLGTAWISRASGLVPQAFSRGGDSREALQAEVYLEWITRACYTLRVSVIEIMLPAPAEPLWAVSRHSGQ